MISTGIVVRRLLDRRRAAGVQCSANNAAPCADKRGGTRATSEWCGIAIRLTCSCRLVLHASRCGVCAVLRTWWSLVVPVYPCSWKLKWRPIDGEWYGGASRYQCVVGTDGPPSPWMAMASTPSSSYKDGVVGNLNLTKAMALLWPDQSRPRAMSMLATRSSSVHSLVYPVTYGVFSVGDRQLVIHSQQRAKQQLHQKGREWRRRIWRSTRVPSRAEYAFRAGSYKALALCARGAGEWGCVMRDANAMRPESGLFCQLGRQAHH